MGGLAPIIELVYALVEIIEMFKIIEHQHILPDLPIST